MALQETAPSASSSIGIKRKLSNGDDIDNKEFDAEVMNPTKRHTESERIKNTDIPFESQAAEEISSDSEYEYTFYDDDKSNEPFIPISSDSIKTKHIKQSNMNDIAEDIDMDTNISKFVDDDENENKQSNNNQRQSALDLNWSDEDDCIEQYESDTNNNKDANDQPKEPSEIAWFPQQNDDNNDSTAGTGTGTKMKYNKSAYNVLFDFHTEWPCLSFDIIRDNLGAVRSSIPFSMYLVAGTQADPNYRNDAKAAIYKNQNKINKRVANKIQFLKLNEIQKTKYDDDEEDENEEKDEEYANITDDDPIIQNRDILHPSIVNRIKTVRCNNNQTHLVATMGADCNLYIWNGTEHILSLDGLSNNLDAVRNDAKPVGTFGHDDEGYALNWNANGTQLLTGSCAGELRLYEPKSNGSFHRTMQFKTLKASIEDVEWSPAHSDIFVSVGVDKCIRIWDTRNHKKEHVARIQNAHRYDINVCSWNPHNGHDHLLLTGSDDRSFKIWDLRKLQNKGKYGKKLKKCGHYYLSSWHIGPITSIEWHPNDSSSAMVASEDNQISIWDFSLERDDSVAPNTGAKLVNEEELSKIPPQLTFTHGGQTDIKEIHFHPQIPNMCISTAGSGFQLFQPDNLMESFRDQFQNMNIVD